MLRLAAPAGDHKDRRAQEEASAADTVQPPSGGIGRELEAIVEKSPNVRQQGPSVRALEKRPRDDEGNVVEPLPRQQESKRVGVENLQGGPAEEAFLPCQQAL